MAMTIMVMTMVMTIMMRPIFFIRNHAVERSRRPQSHGSRSRRLMSAANASRNLRGNYQWLCVYLLHAAATATLVDRIAIRAAIREAAKLLHGDTPANPPNHQREEPALE